MRRVLIAVLSVVVVVAMMSALWSYIRAESRQGRLVVSSVTGEVLVTRVPEDAAGPEQLHVVQGTELHPDDRVGTGPDGRAVLSLGRDTHIRIGPSASVAVLAVDDAGVSLELEDGALQATVRPESGGVRLSNHGRQVLATNSDFEMGVANDVLQVSVSKGALSLSGTDRTRLEEGEVATVIDRHAEVGPIPEELLLAVDWPQEARTRAKTTRVSGRTQPGAKITLSGTFGTRTAVADVHGTFLVDLPLSEGDNPIEVLAVDVLGQKTTIEGMLQTRDTRGPIIHGEVEYEKP